MGSSRVHCFISDRDAKVLRISRVVFGGSTTSHSWGYFGRRCLPREITPRPGHLAPRNGKCPARTRLPVRHNYLALLRKAVSAILLAATISTTALPPLHAAEPSASKLAGKARKYEKKKDYANAYLYWSMAAAKDPARREYWLRAQALQRRAIEKAGILPQTDIRLPVLPPEDDPEALPLPSEPTDEDREEARKPQPPVEVVGAPGERDLDFRGDYKKLWEEVAKAYALDVIFDGDYEAGRVLPFRITGADYRTALTALSVATGSFFVPVSPSLLLVVKDTEPKRREVENTVAISVPIPDPITLQEAQELARSVQQVMEIQRFAIDSTRRMAILRDRISKVRPAQLLFEELLHSRAEVAVTVQLFAWGRSSSRTFGTNLPTSTAISPLIKTMTLAGSPVAFALGIGGAAAVATASKSEARLLYQGDMRSLSGEKASLLVGQKYPIQTLAYIGNVGSGENVYRPPASFNFEDLGFNVKLTPRVHDTSEVSFDVDTEFKLLGNGSLNGIPVISNRKFVAQVRMRFDESAVISGLVSRTDARSLSGPAGLLSLPGFAALLGSDTRAVDEVELVLVLTPRLLNTPPTEFATREIWLGSESRPRIPL